MVRPSFWARFFALSTQRRLYPATIIASISVYLIAVLVLHPTLQGAFPMFSALPVLVLAYHHGVWGALWAGAIAVVVNLVLIRALGVSWLPAAFIGGHGILIMTAVLLGWVVQLQTRLRNELTQRQRTEELLCEERNSLKQLHDEQLQHADRLTLLGTSVAGLAHELNNPLLPMRFGLRYVREELGQLRGTDPDRVDALLDEIRQQEQTLERLCSLVQDLRMLRPAPARPAQSVDLHQIIETALATTRRLLEPYASVSLALGPVPRVRAYPAQLVQVVLNLLLNARDALDPASSRRTIQIVTHTDPEGRALVDVEDTGAGIRAEDLPQIFEPFFTTKGDAGTGLGLHVSQRIVEAHKGRIEVESRPGEGTRFRITLPPDPTGAAVP